MLPSYTSVFQPGEIDKLERERQLAEINAARASGRTSASFAQNRMDVVRQQALAALKKSIEAQADPMPWAGGLPSVAGAMMNFGPGMRRMEGRVAQADLEAILGGEQRPRRGIPYGSQLGAATTGLKAAAPSLANIPSLGEWNDPTNDFDPVTGKPIKRQGQV